jgi:hypothetical protein
MTRGGNCLVDPVWPLRDGALVPVDWAAVRRSDEAKAVVAMLGEVDVGGGSLLLRGSLLEQLQPHPKADIDLILVSSQAVRIDLGGLARFGRTLDLCRVDPGDDGGVLMTLARTRALWVAGAPFPPAPVSVTGDLVLRHWIRYSDAGFNPRIHARDRWFVPRVKQLLRLAGIIRLVEQGEYSRDLRRCAAWMSEIEPEWGKLAADLMAAMEDHPDAWFDTSRLRRQVRDRFYRSYRGSPLA